MYGKALNNPIEGLQKMQRYGVVFSEQEKQRITQLQNSGHLVLAQKAMMEAIAGSGYAGVAEKMFNADPMNRFNKMMERSKENVGELYKTVVDKFAPLMESIANSIGDSMDFEKIKAGLSEFTDKAIEVVKGIINFVKPLIEPIQRYIMAVWEGGKKIFASWGQFAGAGGGIFTWIRDRIGEIINAITYVYSAITSLIAGIIDVFHTIYVILDKLGIIWLIGKVFDTVWGLVKVIASGLAWIYENTIKPVVDAISWAYNKVKDLLGIKDVGIVATVKTTTETNSLIPGKEGKQGKAGSQAETPTSTPATKAEGRKTINIHVAYNAPLITGFTISTVNLKEGLQNLKDMVSDILVSATHDSLMVADH
jgi:phage-related protein